MLRRLTAVSILASLVMLAGCNVVPMTYEEWKQEQERRRTASQTGIEFKSKRQLLKEGRELNEIASEVEFP